MEAVVIHKVGFLAYSCPKQGQDFTPCAGPLKPNMGQVPPPPRRGILIRSFDLIGAFRCFDDNSKG